MPGRTRASNHNPADYTGRKAAELEAKAAEDAASQRENISRATAAKAEAKKEPVDYTSAPVEEVTEVADVEVNRTVTIRVNNPITQMTFGAGNLYDFEPGREYKVPKTLADHLEGLGYVYH